MALLSVIRRWHLRDKISIREIALRTKLSCNTFTKYLASGETSPRYPHRKSPSGLNPYAADLASWLRAGQERLRTVGRGTFVPLVFAPGEAFQFNWRENVARIGGQRVKLQIAQFKLCHSRAFLLPAYPLQTHEMLLLFPLTRSHVNINGQGTSTDERKHMTNTIWNRRKLETLSGLSLAMAVFAVGVLTPAIALASTVKPDLDKPPGSCFVVTKLNNYALAGPKVSSPGGNPPAFNARQKWS